MVRQISVSDDWEEGEGGGGEEVREEHLLKASLPKAFGDFLSWPALGSDTYM